MDAIRKFWESLRNSAPAVGAAAEGDGLSARGAIVDPGAPGQEGDPLMPTGGLFDPAAAGPGASTTPLIKDPLVRADSEKPKSKKVPRPGDRMRDWTDKQIEDLVNDPEKRVEALLAWDMNPRSNEFKDDKPATRVLDDLKTGITKSKEYIDYFNKAIDYASKLNTILGLDKVGEIGKAFKKITGKLNHGLDKANEIIDDFEHGAAWVKSADKFANASISMKPENRATLQPWVDSMKDLKDATGPFFRWAKKRAAKAVVEGAAPEVAAAFSVTFNIVGALLEVGLAALEAGLKVVNAYLDRYDKINKQIDAQVHAPDLPTPPVDNWKTREERQHDAEAMDKVALERRLKGSRDEEKEYEDKKRDPAQHRFKTAIFPNIYFAHRPEIRRAIEADVMAAQRSNNNDALRQAFKCLQCLIPMPGDHATNGVPDTKEGVTGDEADREIDQFVSLSKPCPAFAKVYDPEFKKFKKDPAQYH